MKHLALIVAISATLMLMTSCSFNKQEPAKETPLSQTKPNTNNNTYNTYNTYTGNSGSGSTGSTSSTAGKTTTKKYIAPKKIVSAKKHAEAHDADAWYFNARNYQQPQYIYVPVPAYNYAYTTPGYAGQSYQTAAQPNRPYNDYDVVGALNYAN